MDFMYSRSFCDLRFYLPFLTEPDWPVLLVLLSGFRRGVISEIWQAVPGQYVFNLTSSSQYQENANIKDILSHFAADREIGDNYGQRLTTFYRVSLELSTG